MREVMAFGDNDNDAEMLRLAGLGVAMGNASARAKVYADSVIGRHNTPAIADFWQPYPFLNVNKKPRRVFISAGFLSVRALITLLSDHGSHGGDRFPSGDVYGYG